MNRHQNLAEETGVYFFRGLRSSSIPGIATTEVHFRENAMAFDLEKLKPFLKKLVIAPL